MVVRRSDEPMAALMTPEQVELIRKNLALKIEAARLALIHKDEALYAASLSITAEWLAAYFDANDIAVKVAIEEINTLKGLSITVELPDISKSLQMLRNLPLTSLEPEVVATPAVVEKVEVSAPVAEVKVTVETPKPEATPAATSEVKTEPTSSTPSETSTAPSEEKAVIETTDKN